MLPFLTTAKSLRELGCKVPAYVPDEACTLATAVEFKTECVTLTAPLIWRDADGHEVAAWVGTLEGFNVQPLPVLPRLALIRRATTPAEAQAMDEECAELMFDEPAIEPGTIRLGGCTLPAAARMSTPWVLNDAGELVHGFPLNTP